MTNTYSVYWYAFSDYKGRSITAQKWSSIPYLDVLYKIGYQRTNNHYQRVIDNLQHEKDKSLCWNNLWGNIQLCGLIPNLILGEALDKETHLLGDWNSPNGLLGRKDVSIHEAVSGVREFRLASPERKELLLNYFNANTHPNSGSLQSA
jgi:hypothetical protein